MPSANPDQEQSPGDKPQGPSGGCQQGPVARFSAFIDTYREEQKSNREQEASEDAGRKQREWATLIFVILTTIGIFYQAWIFNSTDQAAHETAGAAISAVETAKKAMILDQRAWIGIESMDPIPSIPKSGETFAAAVRIKNTGKTPSRDTVIVGRIDPIPIQSRPIYSYDADVKRPSGSLAPNAGASIPFTPLNDASTKKPAPLTDDNIASITNGKIKIFVHGRIDYKDIFDEPHWTTFCAFLAIPLDGHFTRCETNNDTDDYKETHK
jgi:hypothetical protein